ncbi:hypothetical protein [Candidatus Nitrospira allomarina]|uniref:Lipoprotein n=1 Tax=Candidatus Nitrospira allomarina TaxID=3020900 RepID=A0AA96GCN0_9BACT|nr:hypothetical protein [Candidatus Nitrospira allomarina]WNM58597.1 hypothetical protein PP769_02185 [Candidatus Nitrospira allomarina]
MRITKFLFLLSIFMLMAGCSSLQGHPVVGQDGDGRVVYQHSCPRSPVDPPSGFCRYALEDVETVEIDGKLYLKGLLPQAVLDDRQDELEMMGQIVSYKDYARRVPNYFPIREKDKDEVKQGAILLLVAPPSKSSKDYYVLLDRVLNSEEELKKHLAELRKQATP